MKNVLTKLLVPLGLAVVMGYAALAVTWVGNTKLWLNGNAFPVRGGYIESFQNLTITAQTYPVQPNQVVKLVYTTNGWASSQELAFNYDYIVGANSQWWVILGPLAKGTWVDFYIKADSPGETTKYDSNNSSNFGFLARNTPNFRSGAILQWFETDYKTILKRLPEVVKSGYSAIYLPSPVKSGGGTFSVGYNPFDRFDLGDRLQKGTVRTKYGSTQELQDLIKTAKRFGIEVYCDIVLNHNDNRASSAINSYPDMIPEDFHINSSANTTNTEINFNNNPAAFSFALLNQDLVGLSDISHEDGNNTASSIVPPSYAPFNSFNKPSYVRQPLTPQYYPNQAPVAEDVRQYLKRWMLFLTQTIGFDGYRLDAVKHMPPQFLGYAPDQPSVAGNHNNGNLLPWLQQASPNVYTFGEDYSSGTYELKEYAKTGQNLLDFPLVFNLKSLFNANGFGDIGASLGNNYGVDSATGLPYEHGGLGPDAAVGFVQSHDDGPPTSNNMAYAFLLTRNGRPKVYYDGNNVQVGNYANFPRPGRGDALEYNGIINPLLDVHNRFGRGGVVNRLTTADLYVYERQVNGASVLLVGLNDRGDVSSQTTTVPTAFLPGTVLRDYSGQQPNVTVAANGTATITVPSNSTATISNNARGYVLYAPVTPAPLALTPAVSIQDGTNGEERIQRTIPEETISLPGGSYSAPTQSYTAYSVKNTNTLDLFIKTDATGFSAVAKLDSGLPMAGLTPMVNTPEGITDGFVATVKKGAGLFELRSIDVRGLDDGLHVIRVRVFTNTGTRPGLYSEFPVFINLNRGQGGTYKADGDLLDLGTAASTQGRTSSSNSNRLDGIYLRNDAQFLYIGMAGRVDTSENLTNGMFMFLDTDPTTGTGVQNFATIKDDSGPATRLLSNRRVTAPAGFGAEFGVGVFRGASLTSSPGTSFFGGPTLPPTIGATAGLFKIDPAKLNQLIPTTAAIATLERLNRTDPAKGAEVQVRLRDLFPTGLAPLQKLGLCAGLGSTGESGNTLISTDPLRATLGGRPAPLPWTSNQFLPFQAAIVNDPGTAAVTLTASYTYTVGQASIVPSANIIITSTPTAVKGGFVELAVKIANVSGATLTGPLNLIVRTTQNYEVVSRSGVSVNDPAPFVALRGTLPTGQAQYLTIRLKAPNISFTPTFELWTGSGAF